MLFNRDLVGPRGAAVHDDPSAARYPFGFRRDDVQVFLTVATPFVTTRRSLSPFLLRTPRHPGRKSVQPPDDAVPRADDRQLPGTPVQPVGQAEGDRPRSRPRRAMARRLWDIFVELTGCDGQFDDY